jgi:hypothetical protein
MQDVIVDTTDALYAAATGNISLRLGFNGVCCYESPPSLRRASRSKLAGEGAAFGPPFLRVGLGRDAMAAKKVVAPFPQVGTSRDHWRFHAVWLSGLPSSRSDPDGPSTAAATPCGTDSRCRR